jgi:hypothetical protein
MRCYLSLPRKGEGNYKKIINGDSSRKIKAVKQKEDYQRQPLLCVDLRMINADPTRHCFK